MCEDQIRMILNDSKYTLCLLREGNATKPLVQSELDGLTHCAKETRDLMCYLSARLITPEVTIKALENQRNCIFAIYQKYLRRIEIKFEEIDDCDELLYDLSTMHI
jgi:hypothetical protein